MPRYFRHLGRRLASRDHEAANECLRIYNDFLKDFCSHYPDRQVGLACLPYGDIDAAVKEVYRVAKLGLKGLELSCSWDMEPMWHPMWEPLWKAVSDVQLPLHFHTFPAMPPRVRGQPAAQHAAPGAVHNRRRVPDEPDQHHRRDHRRRRTGALSEHAGRLWRKRNRLAALRARPDGFRVRGPLPRPDEAEAKRILAPPVQGDVPVRPDGPKLIEEMGVETLMWGSDYPHPDGVWPESSKYIEEQFAGLTAETDPQDHLRERRQVLRLGELTKGGTAAQSMPLTLPRLAARVPPSPRLRGEGGGEGLSARITLPSPLGSKENSIHVI